MLAAEKVQETSVEKKDEPPKTQDAAMKEALKVAQDLERMEEEEMIKRAIEESQKLEQVQKSQADEEEEMIRQAIMLS